MAKVSTSLDLDVPAATVWKMIGGFNALPDWHPAVAKSSVDGDGKGSVRSLELFGGGTVEERLEEADDGARTCTYSIVSGPLPVADYQATLAVHDRGDGTCTVEWRSNFEPSGVSENEAVKIIEGGYRAGFDNLKMMFGAKPR